MELNKLLNNRNKFIKINTNTKIKSKLDHLKTMITMNYNMPSKVNQWNKSTVMEVQEEVEVMK